MSNEITLRSDKFTQMLATLGVRYFIDKDFIMTMRASELHGAEEFDNAMAWAVWHGYLEGGIQQIKTYADDMRKLKREAEWDQVPVPQQQRIEELIKRFEMYDLSRPVDDKENIRIIRNFLSDYNENLVDGIFMYDIHTAILNGRFAGRDTIGKVVEISKNALQREYDIQVSKREAEDDRSFLERHLTKRKP